MKPKIRKWKRNVLLCAGSCRDKTHRMRRGSGERWEKTQHHRNFYFKN
jgi:hypothetical protein